MAKPHVLVLPLLGEGHLAPMMHLCGLLVEQGMAVTFATFGGRTAVWDGIQKKGAWPPPGTDIRLVALNPGDDVVFPANAVVGNCVDLAALHGYQSNHKSALKSLVKGTQNVSCGISDHLFGDWPMEVAAESGIPGALLFTGGFTWSWIELNMPRFYSAGLVPMQGPDEPLKEDHLLPDSPFPLRSSDIPLQFWNEKKWLEVTVKHNTPALYKCDWLLVNSSVELEKEMLGAMAERLGPKVVVPVGPLYLLDEEETNRVGMGTVNWNCMEWLDQQPYRSVLYIAFGSFLQPDEEQLEELVKGVEASGQRYLWVVPSSVQARKSFQEFYEKTKSRGYVVEWSPQVQVLAHHSTGAFLSHCGWNSTLNAVASGQPVICMPWFFDQNLNQRLLVEKWKTGSQLAKTAKRDEVESVIRKIMEGEEGNEMRRRAQALQKQVRQSAATVSRGNLHAFIQELIEASFTRNSCKSSI